MTDYKKNSLTLGGAVAMGTGVMIGAGIFALTGQVAELSRELFPYAFLVAAVIAGFSSYSYIKLAHAYPSAGGIATFLKKAYGKSTMTGACALLMYFSMIISESLVARTFGTYTLQLFDSSHTSWLVPLLGVALLLLAYFVNVLGNKSIQTFSYLMAFVKIGGISLLAVGGLWVSGFTFQSVSSIPQDVAPLGFLGAVALAILAYKGFTTITNSGGEVKDPNKNIGRAIIISLGICAIIYVLVSFAVAGNLSIEQIVQSKDFVLAEAARPAFGQSGVWMTVGIAIASTLTGVIASVFAASRMIAMLTEMKLVPHTHLGMSGDTQKHTLIYTVAIAIGLTVLFDLSRIASLGSIFYLIMDIAIHWGVYKYLREKIEANSVILLTAIVLDVVVLGAFIWMKIQTDMLVIWSAIGGLLVIFVGEKYFLKMHKNYDET